MQIDNNCRKDIIKLLIDIINDKKKAEEIENSIFNFTKDYTEANESPDFLFQSIYETKSNDIINEITNKDSDFLLKAIKNNTIKINEISFLKPEELKPDKY